MEVWSLRTFLKLLFFLVCVTLICFFVSFYLFLKNPILEYKDKNDKNNYIGNYVFEIENGDHLRKITKKITNSYQNIQIRNNKYLYLLAKLKQINKKIKIGEYEITNTTNPNEFLNKVVQGEVIQYKFTIIAGWRFADLFAALKKAPNLLIDQDLDYKSEINYIKDKLNLSYPNLEGLFFPDTYYYTKNTSHTDLLLRAYDRLEQELDKNWLKLKNSKNILSKTNYTSAYEGLILASIIEKESAYIQELNRISGVYHRRLAKKMRLQADPTVVYALGEKHTKKLYYKDLKVDSVYNTYVNYGLPPTPISIPSKESISAAFHPNSGLELYFVANKDGTHTFSVTFEEHNQAKDS